LNDLVSLGCSLVTSGWIVKGSHTSHSISVFKSLKDNKGACASISERQLKLKGGYTKISKKNTVDSYVQNSEKQ